MSSIEKLALLEIYDFPEKKILYLIKDRDYLDALAKRECKLLTINSDLIEGKYRIYEWDKKTNIDCVVVTSEDLFKLHLLKNQCIKNYFIIVNSFRSLIKLEIYRRKSEVRTDCRRYFYSVMPRLDSPKIITVENCKNTILRYWSLRSNNIFIVLKNILEWWVMKIPILRFFIFSKVIMLKC